MDVNVQNVDGKTLITVIGRMDTVNVAIFQKAIDPLLNESNLDIVIDCKEMEYISSSGLRSFILLLKSCKKNGSTLVVKNLTPIVLDVFNMTGFSSLFTIE